MSLVANIGGCCCGRPSGHCSITRGQVYDEFFGWKHPEPWWPVDVVYEINSSSTGEELDAWSNATAGMMRSFAQQATCGHIYPWRYLRYERKIWGTYKDGDEVVAYEQLYIGQMHRELETVGGPPDLQSRHVREYAHNTGDRNNDCSLELNLTTGAISRTGTEPTIQSVFNEGSPHLSDVNGGVLTAMLGGRATFHVLANSKNPTYLQSVFPPDGTEAHYQVTLSDEWTWDQFEAMQEQKFAAIQLHSLDHEYTSDGSGLFGSEADYDGRRFLMWGSFYRAVWSSHPDANDWPNRIVVIQNSANRWGQIPDYLVDWDNSLDGTVCSRVWFDWTPLAGRWRNDTSLSLIKSVYGIGRWQRQPEDPETMGPEKGCLVHVNYQTPPTEPPFPDSEWECFSARFDYGTPTGISWCEPIPSPDQYVVGPGDVLFANGQLWIGKELMPVNADPRAAGRCAEPPKVACSEFTTPPFDSRYCTPPDPRGHLDCCV